MHADDALDVERRGADAGLNPVFGEWQHMFALAPVPYRDGGSKLRVFHEAMFAELAKYAFFFSGEVRLDVVLHLDVQTVLETDSTADLDNFAKAILDGLKGPQGVLLDDTQVQALTIYWLDSYGKERTRFNVTIHASPDDFLLKPLEFYELADRLWYPHGRVMWTDGKAEEQPEAHHWTALLMLDAIAGTERRSRHAMRKRGLTRLQAFQQSQYLGSTARGFHRSRVDTGFALHSRPQWMAQLQAWKLEHPGEMDKLEALVMEIAENRERMAALLRGELPDTSPSRPDAD